MKRRWAQRYDLPHPPLASDCAPVQASLELIRTMALTENGARLNDPGGQALTSTELVVST